MGKKAIIGIMGGIGSGKSTVAAEFGRFGCCVIDADAIVASLLETEEIKLQITESFGNEVFDESGAVDRGRLAEMVFAEKANVEKINGIVHPPVLAQIEELIAEYDESDARAIVLDMPLLVEVGWSKRCDKLIFVACDEQLRTQRMAQKSGFTKKQLKNREKFQILLDSKAQIADYTVRNDSGLAELSEQIVHIFTQIQI
jgi:dephospho-CoA kinase